MVIRLSAVSAGRTECCPEHRAHCTSLTANRTESECSDECLATAVRCFDVLAADHQGRRWRDTQHPLDHLRGHRPTAWLLRRYIREDSRAGQARCPRGSVYKCMVQ